LLGGLNLLRAGRPGDSALAWFCLIADLCWIVASARFGVLVGNLFDFRPPIFIVITLGLCGFCMRTVARRS